MSRVNKVAFLEQYSLMYFIESLGMSDNISYSKVIVHRNSSHAYRIQGGTGGKSYTSVLYCGSATGQILPPFVVYKAKRLYSDWALGGPPDAGYDCSDRYLHQDDKIKYVFSFK